MPSRERSGAGKTTSGGRPSESGRGREPGDPGQGQVGQVGQEGQEGPERLPEPVVAALQAVMAAPAELAVWDRLEATAAEHESTLAVADAYRKALHEPHQSDGRQWPLVMLLPDDSSYCSCQYVEQHKLRLGNRSQVMNFSPNDLRIARRCPNYSPRHFFSFGQCASPNPGEH